jgi:DNA invertase Pin-like site-specific DNA recombinase
MLQDATCWAPFSRSKACGVDLYLDQQSIDTATPAGKLMFQVTGAFAEFERSMIRHCCAPMMRRGFGQWTA